MTETYLAVSSRAVEFLSRHPQVSRRAGGSAGLNDSFKQADSEDREAESIRKFRGLHPYGTFSTTEPGNFRGIGLDVPDSEIELPAYKKIKVHINVDEAKAMDRVSWNNLKELMYTRRGSEAGEVLEEPGTLNTAYVEGNPTPGLDQESEIAAYADTEIPGTDRETWVSQPDLARLALENRGELAERIADSDDLREALTAVPDDLALERARTRVREEVSGKLRNSSDILDEEFLEDNPLATLDLLQNPAKVKWVEENRENAKQYRRDAGRTAVSKRAELAGEAAERVQNQPFDETWFEGNLNVAETVVADAYTGHGDALGTFLETQGGTSREEASATRLASKYWAEIGKRETGGDDGPPGFLFDENRSLAMMASIDSELAGALKADALSIRTSYPQAGPFQPETIAFRAYGLGLADRIYGNFQRVA